MNAYLRAAAAAAAIAHASGRRVASIYDHHYRREARVGASASGNDVEGFDADRQCRVAGTLPNLYDEGGRTHLHLTPAGDGRYEGYDHGSATHFELKVTGRAAQLFDHQAGTWNAYSARDLPGALSDY